MKQTLGTQLRHLIELLDGAVEAAYAQAGLDYRPRYTPVLRALLNREPLTLGEIAAVAGLTQPAATQTVALMVKEGLLRARSGREDARQKLVSLTPMARELLPQLERCWQATAAAASSLESELPHSLTQMLAQAIEALDRKSFGQRITEARGRQDIAGSKAKESSEPSRPRKQSKR